MQQEQQQQAQIGRLPARQVFNWKVSAFFPKGILGAAILTLIALAFVTFGVGYYMSYTTSDPAIGANKVCYYGTIEKYEGPVMACTTKPQTTVAALETELRTHEGLLACTWEVIEDGNHNRGVLGGATFGDMSVEVEGGRYLCQKGFDPSESDVPKPLDGIEDLVTRISKNPDNVASIKGAFASNDYKTSELSQLAYVKMGTIENLKERLQNARDGKFEPICRSKTYEKDLEKFLCAHVLLGQIPQGADCYNRKDPRHVNAELLSMIEKFERGDLEKRSGEAELERFQKCAVLLDTYVTGASLKPDQLLLEREKKIENERFGFRAYEKCRKYD